jgi:hypothetical protein
VLPFENMTVATVNAVLPWAVAVFVSKRHGDEHLTDSPRPTLTVPTSQSAALSADPGAQQPQRDRNRDPSERENAPALQPGALRCFHIRAGRRTAPSYTAAMLGATTGFQMSTPRGNWARLETLPNAVDRKPPPTPSLAARTNCGDASAYKGHETGPVSRRGREENFPLLPRGRRFYLQMPLRTSESVTRVENLCREQTRSGRVTCIRTSFGFGRTRGASLPEARCHSVRFCCA